MAVGQDNLERDPRLARIYAAVGGEEPPAEVDAAIKAAARRAVGSGPAIAGAAPRARRNWHVPVSLAAVLVLSVSLVTLVREEKGGELTQVPAPASVPAAPPVAQAPELQPKTVDGTVMKDAPVPAEAYRDGAAKPAPVTSANEAKGPPGHREKSAAAPSRKMEEADAAVRANVPRTETVLAPAPVVGGATGAAVPAPVAPAPPREAEAAREVASADSPRAPPPAPAPVVAAKPAQGLPAETKLSTPMVEGRIEDRARVTERPVLRSARRDAPAAAAASPSRPAWLAELDNQTADKWLERLAEFRREGRMADADLLLAEFRKRFPDHPVSR